MSQNLSEILSATDEQMKGIDTIVLIDSSGSMGDPSQRFENKSKWDELKEDLIAVAREMGKHDADGLTVIAFSNNVDVKDGVTADTVSKLFAERSPRGSTNLTDALIAACTKARASTKQCVVLVYTDGSPDSAASAKSVLEAIGKELGRPRIGFCFIQVGNDAGAATFLKSLDEGLSVDVVATVNAKNAESLSPQQLVWLAQNG